MAIYTGNSDTVIKVLQQPPKSPTDYEKALSLTQNNLDEDTLNKIIDQINYLMFKLKRDKSLQRDGIAALRLLSGLVGNY